MNSPLVLFEEKLPIELINIIQSYLSNDIAFIALKEHYDYLFYKRDLYENFVYTNYILPNCYCYTYYNPRANRIKTRDCNHCFKYEYTNCYMMNDFEVCIYNNDQVQKVCTMYRQISEK